MPINKRKGRFTAYCLDVGDTYLGDCIADYYPPSDAAEHILANQELPSLENFHQEPRGPSGQRGQLRLSSGALHFEPDRITEPICAFRFKEVVKQQQNLAKIVSCDGEMSPSGSPTSRPGPNGSGGDFGTSGKYTYFALRCDVVQHQLIGGEMHPWKAAKSPTPNAYHCFCLLFPKQGDGLLAQLGSLLSLEKIQAAPADKAMLLDDWRHVQEEQTPFSLTNLKRTDEKILVEQWCSKIDPLIEYRGRLVISSRHLYFQQLAPLQAPAVSNIPLDTVRRVERRSIRLDDVGLEVATTKNQELLFEFPHQAARDNVFHALAGHQLIERYRANKLETMTKRWSRGQLSNFDYLMYLNWASGRSLNDLSQYPFLPWILDFSHPAIADGAEVPDALLASDTSSLDTSMFRDLSKPIGALNPKRLAELEERAGHLKEMGEEPYLYGTHFSTPAYVTYFLVREQPELMIALQGGKMDQGSRMFESILGSWKGITSQSSADLKELIPQFYYGNGSFLEETALVDLGVKSDGCRVKTRVELPPWAKSAKHFIEVHRKALEGPVVSKSLHHWIDLMFGFKLGRGPAAWHAKNVFHPYSYAKHERLSKAVPSEVIDAHVREFGQMPRRLFSDPHPPRQVDWTPERAINLLSIMPPDNDEIYQSEEGTSVTNSSGPAGVKNDSLAGSSSSQLKPDCSVAAWTNESTRVMQSPGPSSLKNSFSGPSLDSPRNRNSSSIRGGSVRDEQQQKQQSLSMNLPGSSSQALASSTSVGGEMSLIERELAAMREALEEEEEKVRQSSTLVDDKVEDLRIEDFNSSPNSKSGDGRDAASSSTLRKAKIAFSSGMMKASSKAIASVCIQNMTPDDTTWCFDLDEEEAGGTNNKNVVPPLFLFGADTSGKIAVFHSRSSGKKIRDISGGYLGSVALTSCVVPDMMRKGGAPALFSSQSGSIVVVDPKSGSAVAEREVSASGVHTAAILHPPSAQFPILACGCFDGECQLFSARSLNPLEKAAETRTLGGSIFSSSPTGEAYGEGPTMSWTVSQVTGKIYGLSEGGSLSVFEVSRDSEDTSVENVDTFEVPSAVASDGGVKLVQALSSSGRVAVISTFHVAILDAETGSEISVHSLRGGQRGVSSGAGVAVAEVLKDDLALLVSSSSSTAAALNVEVVDLSNISQGRSSFSIEVGCSGAAEDENRFGLPSAISVSQFGSDLCLVAVGDGSGHLLFFGVSI